MHEPDFWTQSAEAMELSIEGNRLIARELGELMRGMWRKLGHGVQRLVHEAAAHRH